MGGNMAERLIREGHDVVVFNRSPEKTERFVDMGARGVHDLSELADALTPPRVVWLMIPAGPPSVSTIDTLLSVLDKGDLIVDGGNANFRDSIAMNATCSQHGVGFIDAGVSGGIWGLTEGYCIMVGGAPSDVERIRPAAESLAPHDAFAHVGPPGSGHFVKMVHNGIEYGMMQSFAEGFELMNAAKEFELDLHQVATLWQHGSVVRSWLLDLLARSLENKESFDAIRGYVDDSGEGRWTVQEAVNYAVPLPAITASLFARFASRQDESFAAKINAALRNQFGGHAVHLDGASAREGS